MIAERHLIINADDFGQSLGVNRGIIKAYERGVVTSASLMARWPAALEAAAYCREHPGLSLGLHLDLGEWVYRDGTWTALYDVVPLDNPARIREEIERQVAAFRRITGKNPTHLDSHQHVHRQHPIRGITVDIARKLNIPLRHYNSTITYCGEFYGQTDEGLPYPDGITARRFIEILEALQPGFTELGCHPGEGTDLDTMYLNEREEELKVLCDPGVQSAILELGTKLCSFAHFVEVTHT